MVRRFRPKVGEDFEIWPDDPNENPNQLRKFLISVVLAIAVGIASNAIYTKLQHVFYPATASQHIKFKEPTSAQVAKRAA